MFINKDAIKVNGDSWGKYLLSVKYEYNKLWGSDTGRNLKRKIYRNKSWNIPKINNALQKVNNKRNEHCISSIK